MEREETQEDDTRKMSNHVFRSSGSLRKDTPYKYLKPPRSIKSTEMKNKDFITSNYRTKHIAPARMDLPYYTFNQTNIFFNDTISNQLSIFSLKLTIFFTSRMDHRRNSGIFPQLTAGVSCTGAKLSNLKDMRCFSSTIGWPTVLQNLVVTMLRRDLKTDYFYTDLPEAYNLVEGPCTLTYNGLDMNGGGEVWLW